MSHQENYYRKNTDYANFLEDWDDDFYAKYSEALCPKQLGSKVLDIGCGVGQVVRRLMESGYEAHGVEVSEPNIAKAKKVSKLCQLYDGIRLPFKNNTFDSALSLIHI